MTLDKLEPAFDEKKPGSPRVTTRIAISAPASLGVLLIAGAWLVLLPTLVILYIFASVRSEIASSTGSGGIGAVSMNLMVPLAVWLGPPQLLVAAWSILRLRRSRRPAS